MYVCIYIAIYIKINIAHKQTHSILEAMLATLAGGRLRRKCSGEGSEPSSGARMMGSIDTTSAVVGGSCGEGGEVASRTDGCTHARTQPRTHTATQATRANHAV